MRVALLADTFLPLRTSGAVQLRDLSLEFATNGHQITVLVAAPELAEPWRLETWNGVQVLRLKTLKTKDVGYVRRTISEFLMPFVMLRNLRRSSLAKESWDGVIWYSPTIFLGPIVRALKRASRCRSYLIIRDIFPEWAVDMGLMGKNLPYLFFKAVARYQYASANVIGIQTPGNAAHFVGWAKRPGHRVEVLQNWLAETAIRKCSISVRDSAIAHRKIFVYAGNMGIAQGTGIFLDLAERLLSRADIGFLFVGRGSDSQKLRADAEARRLDNVVFFDEIDPDEIPGLYAQCHVGLVALDPRHKTHNIPGKFLSYMRAGLPVLASVNPGNDLVDLIKAERVGKVSTAEAVDELAAMAAALVSDLLRDVEYGNRCKALAERLFSPKVAMEQIVVGLRA